MLATSPSKFKSKFIDATPVMVPFVKSETVMYPEKFVKVSVNVLLLIHSSKRGL
jgi:hypothetical protein